MKFASSYPKISSVLVLLVIVVLGQLAHVDGRKIPEKLRKPNKEIHCPEEKDGMPCNKSARQGDIPKNSSSSEVEAIHNYNHHKATFVRRFEYAMNFAERMVVDFARQLFPTFYGWERNGWEMGVIELLVRTVAKDMLLIMKAM